MDIFVGDGKIKCDYCFGIGACPRCWGRAAIEKINHHLDILYVEKEQKQLCIDNLKLQLVKLEKENELRKRIIDRLPLCPDHRDKIHDRCVECDNENLKMRLKSENFMIGEKI